MGNLAATIKLRIENQIVTNNMIVGLVSKWIILRQFVPALIGKL
jgi:hypothetical protein